MIIKKKTKQLNNKTIPKNILGIYYFIDSNDKIIYIGKSNNIRKRIEQHLRNGKTRMLSRFDKLKILKLNTEIEALLYESQEIKRHKPLFNRRLRKEKKIYSILQKKNKDLYPIYEISKLSTKSLINFMSRRQDKGFIERISEKFNLCDKLNGLEKTNKCCFKYHLKICNGACLSNEKLSEYEKRFNDSLSYIFKYPNNCKITFKDNNFKTEVTILNNQVTKFGIDKKRKHKIEFISYDELKIIKGYQRKYPEKLLEIKEIN